MPITYITGLTALCTLHPGRLKPYWHNMGAPEAWPVETWGRHAELVEGRALE